MISAGGAQGDVRNAFVDNGSRVWRTVFRATYVLVRRANWLTRLFIRMRVPSFDNEIVQLALVGRRSGRPRPVLVTMIRLAGNWYVGHPNGRCSWIENLAATDTVEMTLPRQEPLLVRPVVLRLGLERDTVIEETGQQQVSPARPLYRGARRHILRAGIYVRLEPVPAGPRPGLS